MTGEPLPESLRANPRLSAWLAFVPGGIVEVRAGKVEIGQGILTALAQIVADGLEVPLARVRMLSANTAASPNEGITSGSLSIQDSGKALRHVCAQARAIFLEAAATELGAATEALRVEDGEIVAASGARTSYWALADRGLLERDASAAPPAKTLGGHVLVGESVPRADLPGKVLGRPSYVHDLELPGMLHGRVLRPPSPAARLVSIDAARARAVPGVVAVVRDGRFVGVIAEREEGAVAALERLRADCRWEEAASLPDSAQLAQWLRSQPVETSVVEEKGEVPAPGTATHRATFTRPFTAHASLGPSCAVARWDRGGLHVWTHAQGIFNQRADLALVFAMPAESIVVEHAEGSGCYGHNGADDVALDAALLARAAGGRPVKVLWSREDELGWAPFGPAMCIEIEADVDAEGEVLAWRSDIWSNGHTTRPGRAPEPVLLAAGHLEAPSAPPLAINTPLASGGGAERNAVPAYAIAATRIRSHRVLRMPIRTSALRSLGAFLNVFAIESVVDDVAAGRGLDPLAWRLPRLPDPRAREVLEAAARLADWASWKRAEGRGRGIGYARYKQSGAYCAVVAEVEAAREILVRRLSIAIDVGLAVNPGGVANQVEGGAIQAASWTLKEAVRFDRTRITSLGWADYPILRFSEVPEVRVQVLQRAEEPSMGAGEASMGPTAAAIGNAVRDALGVRVRDLPITAERILAASA
jgi:CO/xanthine dehydrogenase Mo-binding subunit